MNDNDIINKYKKLVIATAMTFRPNSLSDFEDYIQSGYIGLLNAHKLFDKHRNVKFTTFAVNHIRYEILKEIDKNRRHMNIATLNDDILLPSNNEEFNILDWCPVSLTDKDKKILIMKIIDNYTFKEIADRLGCTKQWAHSQFTTIIEKIQDIITNE